MRRLEVSLYGERIGTLERRGAGAIFDPAESWRWARYQPLLGLSWLQDSAPRHASVGLPVWFEALLPDRGSALRVRLAASAGLREEDSFGLLAVVGQDLPGAVRIRVHEAGDGDPDGAASPHPTPTGPLHFSLAGAQLKFSLLLRDEKLILPVHGEEGSFIAKIPGEGFPALPMIEHMTLEWAARCGHEVPAHRLVQIREIGELAHLERFPGETCLVVQRYDRTEAGPVHQEDLCQVFSLPPVARYDDQIPQRGVDYGQLVRFFRDACGHAAALEFTRRLAFTLASGNSDAHLQNWSILLPRSGPVRLAPAYDQVSIIALPRWGWDVDHGPKLALPFGGERRMARVDRHTLAAFARFAGDPSLAGVFLAALERARRVWSEIEARTLNPHREAIEIQWKNVPLLAELSGG